MSDLILVQALAAAGITPDSSKTYTLSEIQAALTSLHGGASVYLGCSSGSLNQVWYFFNVAGNAIDGQYQAVDTRKLPTVVKVPQSHRMLESSFHLQLPSPAAPAAASSTCPSKAPE
jgi:hypothetical protein